MAAKVLVTEEVQIGFSEKISLEWFWGDDVIGESLVDYCQFIDPDGFEYHSGDEFFFTCSERYY